jgi:hypothetical protein
MAQQQQTRASPTGFTTIQKMMEETVDFYLANGGPAVARNEIKGLAATFSFMDEWPSAYRNALARIELAERTELRKYEEREQRRLGEMMTAMMGVAQQTVMQQMAPDKATSADVTLLKDADLSDGHISYCLERLMEERYNGTEEMLFNQKSHWQGVFRLLSDAGMYGGDDFDAFDRLMKRVMPCRVNAAYSYASVKNISQTLFNKPFVKWHYEPGLMKRREPYDRMVAIVERLIILLTTPEKH